MSHKPRLLILITLAEAGGAQTSVALLLPGLTQRFDVTLAAHGRGPLRDAAHAAGVAFLPLEHVRRPVHPWHDALGLIELVRLCRRIRPDIVHAHSSKVGILGRLAAAFAGVPIRIFTVHGWAFAAYRGLPGRLYLWIERLVRRLTTSVVCVAHSERDRGLAARTCDPSRTIVVHNAVDTSSFGGRLRMDGPPRIVSVGRFAFPKDFVTLVDALDRIRTEYRAALVGEGPEWPDVATAVRQRGLSERVELLGTRHDVPELLAATDVFVLSSRSEALPISILEAMAAGLPVVACDVGGVTEAVVDGETGLLVPAEDPGALSAALERLLRDPELCRRMGTSGRRRAQQLFDVSRFRAAHLDLYRRELERVGFPAPAEERIVSAAQQDPLNGVGSLRGAPPARAGRNEAEPRFGERQEGGFSDDEHQEREAGREQQKRRLVRG
jgi:glycosyltransferase involved in cell wall biosynthesis